MSNIDSEPKSLKKLGPIRRKVIDLSPEGMVETGYIEDRQFILAVKPTVKGLQLCRWAASNRDFIRESLIKHGAILFRNFNVETAADFQQSIEATSDGEPLEYNERSSPRTQVSGKIYTSTDYPPEHSIFLHNENSYQNSWPMKVYFFCANPADAGGETPIANCRRVFDRIDPEIRDRLIEKKWMYIRNYNDGFGLSWQTVFQTTDKSQVEAYCYARGIEFEWKSHDRLRTRAVRPAVERHPLTGETVWFNHATFFHVSTLSSGIREALAAEFSEEELPTNTYYGDGSRIEPEALESLRAAYLQEKTAFRWQRGDVLMVDNMLVAHGREPYAGPRKVLVGMAEPFTRPDPLKIIT